MGWSNSIHMEGPHTLIPHQRTYRWQGALYDRVVTSTVYGLSQRTADARLYAEKNKIYADLCYGNNILGIALNDGSGRVVPIDAYIRVDRYIYLRSTDGHRREHPPHQDRDKVRKRTDRVADTHRCRTRCRWHVQRCNSNRVSTPKENPTYLLWAQCHRLVSARPRCNTTLSAARGKHLP